MEDAEYFSDPLIEPETETIVSTSHHQIKWNKLQNAFELHFHSLLLLYVMAKCVVSGAFSFIIYELYHNIMHYVN